MAIAKFEQVKHFIRQQLELGHWSENTKIPSENSLAQEFNCSRMTARRAITELCEAKLLVRNQGLGTFVAPLRSQSSILEIKNISEEIRQRGHQHSVKILSIESLQAPDEIALLLELPQRSQVFQSKIIHLEDGQPIQLEDRYVNPSLVTDYLTFDFEHHTPHELLSLRAPLTEAEHIIEAIIADPKLKQLLELADNEPCLEIKRRTFSSQGVVSFARLFHPGFRYRLGGRFNVSSV